LIIEISSSYNIDLNYKYRIVFIPFGSIEYHGGSLPYGTDTIIADKFSRKCLERYSDLRDTCIYFYPVFTYGFSHEWLHYPGTLSIDPEIYIQMLYSIIDSIESNIKPHGYVFFNAHGGNYGVLHSVSKKLYSIHGKPFILIDIWRIAGRYGLKYCHACSFEARLLKYFTNMDVRGVNNEYCREESLSGSYMNYEAGVCGEIVIDVKDFVEEVCGLIEKSINIISGGV